MSQHPFPSNLESIRLIYMRTEPSTQNTVPMLLKMQLQPLNNPGSAGSYQVLKAETTRAYPFLIND